MDSPWDRSRDLIVKATLATLPRPLDKEKKNAINKQPKQHKKKYSDGRGITV